jgi:DNA-binding NarL/FixJ family response regulator
VDSPDDRSLRVVVVDDHRMFADSLVRLLREESGFDVLDACVDTASALESIVENRPDVALVDYQLPDGNGVDLTRALLERVPHLRVVMLTGQSDDGLLLRAIEAGVSGFLTKDQAASVLTDSLRQVARGESLMAPEELRRVMRRVARSPLPTRALLSERERDVLRLMSEGLTTKMVAERLFLSVNTVRNYSQSVLTKLGAHSKLEAVAIATREGILPLDDYT